MEPGKRTQSTTDLKNKRRSGYRGPRFPLCAGSECVEVIDSKKRDMEGLSMVLSFPMSRLLRLQSQKVHPHPDNKVIHLLEYTHN